MAGNFLEDLVKEWLEFQGFLVKQKILVDPRPNGGFNSELDVVGYHPRENGYPRMNFDSRAGSIWYLCGYLN